MNDDEKARLEAALYAVQERIGNGTTWLAANCGGQGEPFHFWYTAGILPSSPMPSQPSHVREAYGTYYNARRTFDALHVDEKRLLRQLGRSA